MSDDPRRITIGSLFSGVGGLELGLETALRECGYEPTTVFQVEREEYPSSILARHWPHAVRYDDVCTVGAVARERCPDDPPGPDIAHALPRVDVLCGGSPCQDLSYAGKGAGITGARSGLWFEYLRIVRELRPRIVVVENVPALAQRGLDVVLGGLAQERYDAVWFCVAAADVGAPQLRERIFIIAWDTDARDGDTTDEAGPPHVSDPCCKGLEGHWRPDEHDCAGEGAHGGADAGRLRGDGSGGWIKPQRAVDGPRWPTPNASDCITGGQTIESWQRHNAICAERGVHKQLNHGVAVKMAEQNNWPTPCTSLFNDGEDPAAWLARAEELKASHQNGNGAGMPLAIAAKLAESNRWPTPRVFDAECRNTRGGVGKNLGSVEELWQTPTVGCVTGGQKTRGGDRANELLLNGQAMGSVGATKGLFLSPRFVECLQSFPDGWTERPEVHTEPFAGVWRGWPARPNEPQHPWEAPRVTTDTKARKQRLKALGNAVVPEVARTVGHVLAQILKLR